jgi:predicted O-methyltransferase YrrM
MKSTLRAKIAQTLVDCWRPHDWFALDERVENHYFHKAAIVADLKPRRVIEIGTRCGYSLACFSTVAPDARYLCIDGAMDEDSLECLAHWQSVVDRWAIDASLIIVDSHAVKSLPPADFAHVDGDHSFAGALADLCLVAHVPAILADDCDNAQVKAAVVQFATDRRRSVDWINDGLRQAAVLT